MFRLIADAEKRPAQASLRCISIYVCSAAANDFRNETCALLRLHLIHCRLRKKNGLQLTREKMKPGERSRTERSIFPCKCEVSTYVY